MRHPSSEQERSAGFLQPHERAFLSKEGYYPHYQGDGESGGRQARSRIRNKIASPQAFKGIIESFQDDLLAVVNHQVHVNEEQRTQFRNTTLPVAKPELETLRDHLDHLIELAENNTFQQETNELAEALGPLYHPLPDDPLADRSIDRESMSEEELEEMYEQHQSVNEQTEAMVDYLELVLSRDDRLEILKHLQSHGKSELSEHTLTGGSNSWAWSASTELVSNSESYPGLVNKDDTWKNKVEYELTDWGEAVLDCWESLKSTDTVQRHEELNPNADTREIVLDLLSRFNRF